MRIKGKNLHVLFPGVLFFVIILFSISAFAQTTIVKPVTPDHSIPVPHMEVSQFAGSSGATIPIVIPPGRNNIEPDLALTYTISQKHGWLGVGWDLDIGSIQRSTKRGVNYTKTDFVVNSKESSFELVRRTDWGSGYYGAKIESFFTRYYFDGSKWVGTTKDGIKYYYGQAFASRQATSDGIKVFKWCLDRVEDPNGNYMTVSYYKDNTNSPGELYLEQIKYTGNTHGLNTTNTVTFYLSPRADIQKNYAPGFEVKTAYRLWSIDIHANGAPVRAYWLQYNDTGVPSQSRLINVTQFGTDHDIDNDNKSITGHHLPEIDLTYKDAETNAFTRFHDPSGIGTMAWEWGSLTRHLTGDFNGDGRIDILKWEPLGGKNYLFLGKADETFQQIYQPAGIGALTWNNGGETHHLTGDFNGDGRADILMLQSLSTGNNYLFLGNANGTFQQISEPAGIGGVTWSSGGETRHLTGDFNGDGRIDILMLQSLSTGNNYLFLGNANGSFQQIHAPAGISGVTWSNGIETRHLTGDFNGDGRTDILMLQAWGGKNYLFLGQADGTFQQIYQPEGIGAMGWSTGYETRHLTGDFNGDGLTDILLWESLGGNNYLFLGKGGGTFQQIYQPAGIGAMEWNTLNTGKVHLTDDFNGDGKTDILLWDFLGNGNYLILSKGDGTFDKIANPPGIGNLKWVEFMWGYLGAITHITGDFNGDGKADILKLESNGSGNDLFIWNYSEPYCALASLENGQGATRTFAYQPSNSYTNTFLPFIVPTVSSMSVNDGIQTATNAYTYGNGLYDFAEREFRGFQYAKQTRPDNSIQETWFHQDYYLKGREYQVDNKNPSGTKLSTETLVWETQAVNNGTFIKLSQKHTDFFDSPTVFSQEDYTYSATHGNVLIAVTSGTDAENITTTITWTNYGSGSPAWLWRKTQETITGATSGKVRETYLGYENGTGNLLSKEFWLFGGTNPQVTMTYDSYGNQITVTDARGNTTTTDYDTATQTYPIKTTYPSTNGVSHIKEFACDLRFGVLDWEKDENQNVTNYDYDWYGRLKRVDFPDGGQTITEYYDNVSFPQYVIARTKEDASSTINKYTYFDGLRREIQGIAFGEGGALIVSKKKYDTMGRNYRNEGPFFNTRSVGYPKNPPSAYPYEETTFDYRSRPTEIKIPDSASTTIKTTFGYSGFSTTITDPDNKNKTEKKDYRGKIIQVTEYGDDGNYYTAYAYNAAGDLLTITDTDNKVTTITPDTLGRKISMADPDMGGSAHPWSYIYDANGNLLTQSDAKSQTITFTYDELNRALTKTYSTSDPAVTYTYDNPSISNGIGRLYGVSNTAVNKTVNEYDPMGRKRKETKTIDAVPYLTQRTYDLVGKPLSVIYPDTYEVKNTYYPGTGLLYTIEEVSDSKVYATMENYQPTGKMGIITYGNAAETTFTYNAYTNRLQSIVTQNPVPTTIQNRAYTYTKAGDISQIIDGIKTITFSYSYDNLHRLTGETHTGSHTYLGGPAILSNNHTDPAHINAVSATTLNGRDYSAHGTEFASTYDANGNQIEGPDFTDLSAVGTRVIEYNADNMPINETYNGTTTTDLTYDGDGVRAKKCTIGGSTTYYIGDQFEVEDGIPIKYLFAGNVRIAQVKGTETSYFHKDHLESSTVTTDELGATVEETEYLPFGLMREHAGNEISNYKYTDQELDKETNLYNYDARLYDPAMGIFTRPDDITQNWYDPQSLNRYAYCRNNPLIYTDPDGHYLLNVHVKITMAAAAQVQVLPMYSNAELHALRVGSKFPDIPGGYTDVGGYYNSVLGKSMWESHHGELQFWHAMASTGTDSAQSVKKMMLLTASLWYSTGDIKDIGKIIHMISDSYSESHVVRNDKGEITQFQDYSLQDITKHRAADKIINGTMPAGVDNAVNASKQLLDMYNSRTEWNKVEKWLDESVWKLFPNAQRGGTAPSFEKESKGKKPEED